MTESRILKGYFLDPYRRSVTPIKIQSKLSEWHRALECDILASARFPMGHGTDATLDIWVDDCGSMRKPEKPTFSLRDRTFYGYGLIFEGHGQDTCSVTFKAELLSFAFVLAFEEWEKRLDVKQYFPQITRVIEWEFPNR
jgi:hypothetical protein